MSSMNLAVVWWDSAPLLLPDALTPPRTGRVQQRLPGVMKWNRRRYTIGQVFADDGTWALGSAQH